MPVILIGTGLLVFWGAMVLIGLSRANDYSLGALLESVGQWFQTQAKITILGVTASLAFIGDGIISLDNTIRNAIGKGIEAMAADAVAPIVRVAVAFEAIGGAIADVGQATAQTLERMLRHSIPALIAARIAGLLTRVHALEDASKFVTHTIPKDIVKVGNVTKVYPVTVERVTGLPKLIKAAVASALAAVAIPHAIPRVGDVVNGLDSIKADLKRLGKYATVSGIIGLVGAAVFSELGLSHLQCSNNKRLGKFLCGFNVSRLESLLAGLALFLGTLSIVSFAKEVQTVTLDFEGEVRKFWRGTVKGPGGDRALGQTGL